MNLAEFQLDPVAQRFFDGAPHELEDPEQPVSVMSRSERRAMRATFAMLAVFFVSLVAFVVYTRVIMPQPVELSAERGISSAAATLEP